jgi:hypothetical protein
MRAYILNAPEGYIDLLGLILENVCLSDLIEGIYEFVHIFVKNKVELYWCKDKAIQAIKYDVLFWIFYPKGSSEVEMDLNRDTLWESLSLKRIRPVSLISIDDV